MSSVMESGGWRKVEQHLYLHCGLPWKLVASENYKMLFLVHPSTVNSFWYLLILLSFFFFLSVWTTEQSYNEIVKRSVKGRNIFKVQFSWQITTICTMCQYECLKKTHNASISALVIFFFPNTCNGVFRQDTESSVELGWKEEFLYSVPRKWLANLEIILFFFFLFICL